MPSCSMSKMQMPTPPMTLVEWERELHQRCDGSQCPLSDGELSPSFEDWTLFPEEESSLAEPTPRSMPVGQNAKTPRPAQGRAQKNSQTRKQQRRNDSKKARMVNPDVDSVTRRPSDDSALGRNVNFLNSNSKEIGYSKPPTFLVAGFEEIPRTLEPAPAFARFPTPPVEDMGEMFAPIEALGEDLRWSQAIQAKQSECSSLVSH